MTINTRTAPDWMAIWWPAGSVSKLQQASQWSCLVHFQCIRLGLLPPHLALQCCCIVPLSRPCWQWQAPQIVGLLNPGQWSGIQRKFLCLPSSPVICILQGLLRGWQAKSNLLGLSKAPNARLLLAIKVSKTLLMVYWDWVGYVWGSDLSFIVFPKRVEGCDHC